jgi:hypothetical protein
MALRNNVLVAVLAVLLSLVLVGPAGADTKKLDSWRNCDNFSSGLKLRAEFQRIPQTYGDGRYYIKSEIKWQRALGTDRWRELDRNPIESPHYFVDNPNFIFRITHGDRTSWLNAYQLQWRAKVTVHLMKERAGPDAKKETFERFFTKAVFREVGSNCD